MSDVAGVDGCKAGWLVVVISTTPAVSITRTFVAEDFAEVLEETADCAAVAVDMPIGIPEIVEKGGRQCDKEARARLKPHGSRVFPSPARAVLTASTYEEAKLANQRNSEGMNSISKQTWAIVPKIADVDAAMTPELQQRVIEIHPELCFWQLNEETPVSLKKSTMAGALVRMTLLAEVGLVSETLNNVPTVPGADLDDVLDATVAAWTALRYSRGEAIQVPSQPPLDGRGLRMEMWT